MTQSKEQVAADEIKTQSKEQVAADEKKKV